MNIESRRVLALSFTLIITLMILSPIFVTAQDTLPGNSKNGPFIEKLVFNVIEGDDQQVLALQNDEIDLIGTMVDPQFLDTLTEAENIDVANVLRNGYGYVTLNTEKYPMNITAFRRALAFAVDKERISDDVWDGLSVPQDSPVPQVNPFSIEGQLPYTYYEANVELGNQILDDAGFHDVDDDDIREAPNGENFDILIECAQSSSIAIEVGQVVASALQDLGIDARSIPTDFYEYLQRLYYHGDYDIVFLGSSFNNFDVDWLAYEYWSGYKDEPFWNFANFANSSYDAWRDQLLHSTEYEEVNEAAIEMQRILVYECPYIICYENVLLSAYRTDRFEGFVNDVSDGVPGFWTNYRIHLKDELGGPFGGSFRWSNPLDIDTFNLMATSSQYSINILQMMYDSLIVQDPDGLDVNWLAEAYQAETHDDNPAVPDGYTRITFDVIQNATWTDGTPITAEDIAFSLNYFRDAPGNIYGNDLTEMTAAYAPTTYRLVVEFESESYWHLHTIGYKPIIPKHVFEEVGVNAWNQYNPVPPEDSMVTSGPFNVSDYVAGEFTEMTRFDDYFYAFDYEPTGPEGPGLPSNLTLAIIAGAVGAAVVILIGGYILMRQ